MKKSAFSLIELLVSLIIVTLVVGSLAPVITKKLKNRKVTVKALKHNQQNAKFDCMGDDFYLLKKEDSGLEYDLCITKYNMLTAGTEMAMSDEQISSAGVTFVEAGTNCDATNKKCCWGKGNTKTSGNATANDCKNDINYSTCYRIACDWDASESICEKYNYGNKQWRLPTSTELEKLNFDSILSDLQLCEDGTGSNIYPVCYTYNGNYCGGANGVCYLSALWSNTIFSDQIQALTISGNAGYINAFYSHPDNPNSARCVTPMQKVEEEPFDCSAYGSKCLDCNDTECTSCDSGYSLQSGKCIVDCTGDDCYVQVGNYLVTKYNMGDATGLPIPESVASECEKVQEQCNDSCSDPPITRTKCTYQGAYAACSSLTLAGRSWDLPSSELNFYSDEILLCPTTPVAATSCFEEFDESTCYEDRICNYDTNVWTGSGGYTYKIDWIDSEDISCEIDFDGYCGNIAHDKVVFNPIATINGSSCTCADVQTIVRCVACGINCSVGQYASDSAYDCTCKECSEFDANCGACTKDGCTQCKDGYTLQDDGSCASSWCSGDFVLLSKAETGLSYDLCVTKYNMLTYDTEMAMTDTVVAAAGVTFVQGGDYCEANLNNCCWGKGNYKSSGAMMNDGNVNKCSTKNDYSGCYRIVCEQDAADAICSNYNYGDRQWRLLTPDEYTVIGKSSNLMGNLNLCDSTSSTTYALCENSTQFSCNGVRDHHCHTSKLWSNDSSLYYYLTNNSLIEDTTTSAFYQNYPGSVRCVTQIGSGTSCATGSVTLNTDNSISFTRGGYLNASNVCTTCSSPCLNCTGPTTSDCTECEPGYSFHNGICEYCGGGHCLTCEWNSSNVRYCTGCDYPYSASGSSCVYAGGP